MSKALLCAKTVEGANNSDGARSCLIKEMHGGLI